MSYDKSRPLATFGGRNPIDGIAAYNPQSHTVNFDLEQVNNTIGLPNTAYHEYLHGLRIGNPTIKYNSKAQAFLKARANNAPNTSEFYDDYIQATRERGNASDYLKYKVNDALFPDAPDYIRQNGELQVHGLEAGKALGLKPFTKYPDYADALYWADKAVQYNPNLDYVRRTTVGETKDFWNLLTGNFAPTFVPVGVTTFLSTYKPFGNQ